MFQKKSNTKICVFDHWGALRSLLLGGIIENQNSDFVIQSTTAARGVSLVRSGISGVFPAEKFTKIGIGKYQPTQEPDNTISLILFVLE
jgi:hypothetical protein